MSTICTYSGRYVDPFALAPRDINIVDIAHALSMQCRFAGHVREFYSVAQHSLIVESLLPAEVRNPRVRLQALLHDAPEAYLSDIVAPVKHRLPEYQALEEEVWKAVALRFDIPIGRVAGVKEADLLALAWERRDLVNHRGISWAIPARMEPPEAILRPMGPGEARRAFIERAGALGEAFQARGPGVR